MIDVLNLGCGNKPVKHEDWQVVNHDLRLDPARPYVTVAWDLSILPWPWDDLSFDRIIACAVLEHLRINLFESIGECYRILRPGGVLHVKLPWWKGDNSWLDPTHYWHFSLRTLDMFDPDTKFGHDYRFYGVGKWKIIEPAKLNNAKTSFQAKLQVRK